MREYVRGIEGLQTDIEGERDERIELVLAQRREHLLRQMVLDPLQIVKAQDQFRIKGADGQASACGLCMPVTDQPFAIRQAACARTKTFETLDEFDSLVGRAHLTGQKHGSRFGTV